MVAKHVVFCAYSIQTLELCLLVAGLLERHLKLHNIVFELVAMITARLEAQIVLLSQDSQSH